MNVVNIFVFQIKSNDEYNIVLDHSISDDHSHGSSHSSHESGWGGFPGNVQYIFNVF